MNCHMCQTVHSSQSLASCSQCPKAYCAKCVKLHLSITKDNNSLKQQFMNIFKDKRWSCFSCNNKCKCQMCSSGRCGLMALQKCVLKNIQNKHKMRNMKQLNVQQMDTIQIFKNQQISQLPIYLQEIWMNKYALYKSTPSQPNQRYTNQIQIQQQEQEQNVELGSKVNYLQNQNYSNMNGNQFGQEANINQSRQIMADNQYQNEQLNQADVQQNIQQKQQQQSQRKQIKGDQIQNKQNQLL